ncbi:class E sortase [Pilimelia columellifera]|uniref:Class E sortase n=1 Tax=Pilimelia columellifera subsp. columellifera TaxID=706583 RepID=A0ABN3N1V9_9ACTN
MTSDNNGGRHRASGASGGQDPSPGPTASGAPPDTDPRVTGLGVSQPGSPTGPDDPDGAAASAEPARGRATIAAAEVPPAGPPAVAPIGGQSDYRSVHSELTRASPASMIRAAIRGFGELMITVGMVILLFAGYEVWGKTAIVDAAQSDLDTALSQQWDVPAGATAPAKPSGKPPPGGAVARLHIPRLDKRWVVVEGVDPKDIEFAPGHYPKSAMPGETGNFSIAGHRVRSTFWDLDDMRVGDPIVVETQTDWHVYTVARSKIVKPTAVEVVNARPPGFDRGSKLLTITTCNPKWDNYERLIVHATHTSSQPRSAGRPAALD